MCLQPAIVAAQGMAQMPDQISSVIETYYSVHIYAHLFHQAHAGQQKQCYSSAHSIRCAVCGDVSSHSKTRYWHWLMCWLGLVLECVHPVDAALRSRSCRAIYVIVVIVGDC